MKSSNTLFLLLCLPPLAFSANDSYDGDKAASYAYSNVYTKYVSNYVISDPIKHKNLNPFNDYESLGGNCTNFVSQAFIGGFSKNTTAWGVFNQRSNYVSDNTWYFKSDAKRGAAWTSAKSLYEYAKRSSQAKGISFSYLGSIRKNYSNNDVSNIRKGDLMSLNQEGNGVNHSMIVTDTNMSTCPFWKFWCTPKKSVMVSYQNAAGYPIAQNNDISNILNPNSFIYSFRPVQYKR